MPKHRYHTEIISSGITSNIASTKASPNISNRSPIPLLTLTLFVLVFFVGSTRIPQKCSITPSSYCIRFNQDLQNLSSSAENLSNSLFLSPDFNEESLNQLNLAISRLDETLSQVKSKTKIDPEIINQLVLLAPKISRLLAVNSQSSYLVLIQDPTELRSSGGNIDTLVYITLTNTHISSTRYFSSSALTATSPAPQSWQQLTHQTNWQIRDTNFNPDFPTSAKEISSLFTRSTSLPVDYVVAVNLTTLSDLLSRDLIPQYIAQFSQTGSNNLYLSSLISSLISNISQLPYESKIQIARRLLLSLQSRQIYLYPSIPAWEGSLVPPSCPTPGCISDFIIPVENHLGPNKSSVYLHRSALLSQSFSDNQINYDYQLVLKNSSVSNVWPAGPVKNYFQLLLPHAVSIDYLNLPYQLSKQPGFFALALNITILPGETQNILIKYHQPLPQSISQYRFTVIPQPGLTNSSLTHKLIFPPSWSVTTHQIPAVAQSSGLQYNTSTTAPYQLDLIINR